MDNQSIEFLKANIHNWNTAKNGYVRNLDINVLKTYESIYKEYIQKDFILTAWCSGCVLDMVIRLYRVYENLTNLQLIEKNEGCIKYPEYDKIVNEEPKKRGRKPKRNEETH